MSVINITQYINGEKRKMTKENSIEESTECLQTYTNELVETLYSQENGPQYTPKNAAYVAEYILDAAYKTGCYDKTTTPVVEIVRAFGIDLCRTNNMIDNMSGVIYVGGKTKDIYGSNAIIFTDNTEPYGHQRFVIAHELAHYLFDYKGNPNRPSEDRVFAENYPRNNHDSDKETRADRFAAALLMPWKQFLKQYNSAMNESWSHIYTIKYLARYFQVKESSVEKRIDEVLYNGGY